jgi:cell division protein FtsI (penicillin-binding protein 3)
MNQPQTPRSSLSNTNSDLDLKPRARGIATGARWFVVGLAVAIVGTSARVYQLKAHPAPELVGSMERTNGRPIQERTTIATHARGAIVDARGRKLAVDTVGGTLFVDLRDLYRDALNRAIAAEKVARRKSSESSERGPMTLASLPADLDPIRELAKALEGPFGVSAAEIARALDEKTPEDLRTLRRTMSEDDWKRLKRYVVLSETLTAEQVDAIAQAKREAGPTSILRGAHVETRPERILPYGDTAAALIGFTGFNAPRDPVTKEQTGRERVRGLSGVESSADKRLASEPGFTTAIVDSSGSVMAVPASGFVAGEPGDDVRLSIDIVIQEIVERRLRETVQKSNAGGGRCIVVDVHSGEILAAYDTLRSGSNYAKAVEDKFAAHDARLARLRWVTDPFEPGSIFKPFVWAWAIELGKARASETIPLPAGPLTIVDGRAKRTIREAHSSSYGTKSWHDCLTKSVNAGMATVAMRMTNDQMMSCLRGFGFDRPTGIGFKSETRGILPPKDEWTNKTRALASVSFGQGIAVTPLQLVHAFTAFCRDGSMVPLSMAPQATGSVSGSEPVVSEKTMMVTRETMQDVIREGTGKKLKDILVYSGFGKSGTAQLVNPKGGYFQDRYMSSFLLGAPFDAPELAILVTIEDPDKSKGVTGGGALAGPCAAHIMNEALEYLGVPTDGQLVYSDKKKSGDAEVAAAAVRPE